MKVKFFSFNEDQNKIIDAILAHNKDFVAVENNYELVVVIGGDGTFLHALNFFKHEDVKIVLINNGKLGDQHGHWSLAEEDATGCIWGATEQCGRTIFLEFSATTCITV